MTRTRVDPMQLACAFRRELARLETIRDGCCPSCGCVLIERGEETITGEHAERCELGKLLAATGWVERVPPGPIIIGEEPDADAH